ncbi:DUF6908 domain-containing protein [Nitrospira sp. BLG_1]|uniref:DUF6908 domain-containing protein n=1 Tax=Nitrospira sp. BLG_1 TaxID=3395883 RepID=UPI0039BD82BC
MNSYQEFAKYLDQLLGGVHAVRITVSGYMPLSVEEIGSSGDGYRLVSLCHYGEQNGDLMRDPDIAFLVHTGPDGAAAEPVSFRNDYLGIVQEVYRYDETGRRTHVVPSLKQELKEFAESWFANLKDQGFFGSTAMREIL